MATTTFQPRPLRIARPARSTPNALRATLAILVVLALGWGALAAITAAGHASAAGQVVATSEPLSLDAQRLYQSLADADVTVSTAYLYGTQPPLADRVEYQRDIAAAAAALKTATAASGTAGGSAISTSLTTLQTALPVYTGYVEDGEVYNSQGLPAGGSYLEVASEQMQLVLLPAAHAVYDQENAELAWLAIALTVGRSDLLQATQHGSRPAETLAQADIGALQARGDEVLNLISRTGDTGFQSSFHAIQATLTTQLSSAQAQSPPAEAALIGDAGRAATTWFGANQQLHQLDLAHNYGAETRLALSAGPDSAGAASARLQSDLGTAIAADQEVFTSNATAGQDAFSGLEIGIVVLALMMAGGCTWGLVRRLVEYR
jgi:hypothetical protein